MKSNSVKVQPKSSQMTKLQQMLAEDKHESQDMTYYDGTAVKGENRMLDYAVIEENQTEQTMIDE